MTPSDRTDLTPQNAVTIEFEDGVVIRTTMVNGEPALVAADLCQNLDIKNVADAVSTIDDDAKGIAIIYTPGGPQKTLAVTMPGAYDLILRSNAANKKGSPAHKFKRWLTHDVIPSIQRTGQYTAPGYKPSVAPHPPINIDFEVIVPIEDGYDDLPSKLKLERERLFRKYNSWRLWRREEIHACMSDYPPRYTSPSILRIQQNRKEILFSIGLTDHYAMLTRNQLG